MEQKQSILPAKQIRLHMQIKKKIQKSYCWIAVAFPDKIKKFRLVRNREDEFLVVTKTTLQWAIVKETPS